MKIEKIEIKTSNKKHVTDIAMLVDKPEFLEELHRLRSKWHITDLYKNIPLTSSIITKILNTEKKKEFSFLEELKSWQEFSEDIDKLLSTFNRGKNFKKIIIYALITGLIPEAIYKSCYFDVVAINRQREGLRPEDYQYVIIMSPRTEKQEIEQAY